MEPMSRCSASSQHGETDADTSNEEVVISPLCKRSCNAAKKALAIMIKNDKLQQEADKQYRAKLLKIQQDMLDLGLLLFNSMTTDIKDMRSHFDSMEHSLNQVVSMLTTQAQQQPVSSSIPYQIPPIPKEPSTPCGVRYHQGSADIRDRSITPTHTTVSCHCSTRSCPHSHLG